MPPTKVFIERIDDAYETFEYSEGIPAVLDRYSGLFSGFYGAQNYLELFYCLPEVFAPIHEIASRIADANWQLCKEFKTNKEDEVDYKDETFNNLFTAPNPIQDHKSLVYMSVVYEILCGKQFWYWNKPEFSLDAGYKAVKAWYNLPANEVLIKMKDRFDPYSATEIDDFLINYQVPNGLGGMRIFDPEWVGTVLNGTDLKDLNKVVPPIAGAEKAIRNLIPVYEARGTIYIKRGEMGFIVNRSKDQSGTIPLKEDEKDEINKERYRQHGLQRNQTPIGFSSANIDFVRTSMSIQELQPFDETVADAAAIYSVLRVPPHLIPRKDHSTFNNADADMKNFYSNVIIPWAKKYALIWTNKLKLKEFRRFVRPNFDHVDVLQENKKEKADVDKTNGSVWKERWEAGVCTLNDWIVSFDGVTGKGPMYEKKIYEMTPEEREGGRMIAEGKPEETQPKTF